MPNIEYLKPLNEYCIDTDQIVREGRKNIIIRLKKLQEGVFEELRLAKLNKVMPKTELIHFQYIDFDKLTDKELVLLDKSLKVNDMTCSELYEYSNEVEAYKDSEFKDYKKAKESRNEEVNYNDSRVNVEMHLVNKVANAILLKQANDEWVYDEEREKGNFKLVT